MRDIIIVRNNHKRQYYFLLPDENIKVNDIPKAIPRQTPIPIPTILSSTFTKQIISWLYLKY